VQSLTAELSAKRSADARQKAVIGDLQAKVETLSSELTDAKATVRVLQEESSRGPKRDALQSREHAELLQVKAKTNELLSELRELQGAKNELTRTLQEKDREASQLQRELRGRKVRMSPSG
jgi:chromosome segregation ATPase